MEGEMSENQQYPLFHEDIHDALKTVVAALGGPQKVGVMLRPEYDEKPDTAGRWLSDCLNPDRSAKLDFDQFFAVLRAGRRIGCHVGMHHITQEVGYAPPQPVEPEDELARLQRQFIESTRLNQDLVQRMEKLVERTGRSANLRSAG